MSYTSSDGEVQGCVTAMAVLIRVCTFREKIFYHLRATYSRCPVQWIQAFENLDVGGVLGLRGRLIVFWQLHQRGPSVSF